MSELLSLNPISSLLIFHYQFLFKSVNCKYFYLDDGFWQGQELRRGLQILNNTGNRNIHGFDLKKNQHLCLFITTINFDNRKCFKTCIDFSTIYKVMIAPISSSRLFLICCYRKYHQ
jgi:hypothetical protein